MKQHIHESVADAAIARWTAACALARIDSALERGIATDLDREAANLHLRTSGHRVDQAVRDRKDNKDPSTGRTSEAAL